MTGTRRVYISTSPCTAVGRVASDEEDRGGGGGGGLLDCINNIIPGVAVIIS